LPIDKLKLRPPQSGRATTPRRRVSTDNRTWLGPRNSGSAGVADRLAARSKRRRVGAAAASAAPIWACPRHQTFATLASRVSVRTSIQRAVDSLDGWQLRVLEALALALAHDGQTEAARAAKLLGHARPEPPHSTSCANWH